MARKYDSEDAWYDYSFKHDFELSDSQEERALELWLDLGIYEHMQEMNSQQEWKEFLDAQMQDDIVWAERFQELLDILDLESMYDLDAWYHNA